MNTQKLCSYRPFFLCISLFGLLVSGCEPVGSNSNRVLIVGKNQTGQEEAFAFPEGPFQRVMVGTLERVHRSTLKTLTTQDQDPSFQLSRVTVGLKLEVEVGIKNLMDLGTEGAFELRFERLPLPSRF